MQRFLSLSFSNARNWMKVADDMAHTSLPHTFTFLGIVTLINQVFVLHGVPISVSPISPTGQNSVLNPIATQPEMVYLVKLPHSKESILLSMKGNIIARIPASSFVADPMSEKTAVTENQISEKQSTKKINKGQDKISARKSVQPDQSAIADVPTEQGLENHSLQNQPTGNLESFQIKTQTSGIKDKKSPQLISKLLEEAYSSSQSAPFQHSPATKSEHNLTGVASVAVESSILPILKDIQGKSDGLSTTLLTEPSPGVDIKNKAPVYESTSSLVDHTMEVSSLPKKSSGLLGQKDNLVLHLGQSAKDFQTIATDMAVSGHGLHESAETFMPESSGNVKKSTMAETLSPHQLVHGAVDNSFLFGVPDKQRSSTTGNTQKGLHSSKLVDQGIKSGGPEWAAMPRHNFMKSAITPSKFQSMMAKFMSMFNVGTGSSGEGLQSKPAVSSASGIGGRSNAILSLPPQTTPIGDPGDARESALEAEAELAEAREAILSQQQSTAKNSSAELLTGTANQGIVGDGTVGVQQDLISSGNKRISNLSGINKGKQSQVPGLGEQMTFPRWANELLIQNAGKYMKYLGGGGRSAELLPGPNSATVAPWKGTRPNVPINPSYQNTAGPATGFDPTAPSESAVSAKDIAAAEAAENANAGNQPANANTIKPKSADSSVQNQGPGISNDIYSSQQILPPQETVHEQSSSQPSYKKDQTVNIGPYDAGQSEMMKWLRAQLARNLFAF